MTPSTLYALCAAVLVCACASLPADKWREQARLPVDNGSFVWWEKARRDF